MLGGSHDKDAPITLCIFPNQREFIAIDTREDRKAPIHVLTVDDLISDEFAASVEHSLAELIRAPGVGITDLMAIPQQIELAMRVHALRRVLQMLGTEAVGLDDESEAVGVLFFSGPMLAVGDTKLGITIREMFGGRLSDDELTQLREKLDELIQAERQAEKAISERSIEGLIRGDDDAFVTIWKHNADQ